MHIFALPPLPSTIIHIIHCKTFFLLHSKTIRYVNNIILRALFGDIKQNRPTGVRTCLHWLKGSNGQHSLFTLGDSSTIYNISTQRISVSCVSVIFGKKVTLHNMKEGDGFEEWMTQKRRDNYYEKLYFASLEKRQNFRIKWNSTEIVW